MVHSPKQFPALFKEYFILSEFCLEREMCFALRSRDWTVGFLTWQVHPYPPPPHTCRSEAPSSGRAWAPCADSLLSPRPAASSPWARACSSGASPQLSAMGRERLPSTDLLAVWNSCFLFGLFTCHMGEDSFCKRKNFGKIRILTHGNPQ